MEHQDSSLKFYLSQLHETPLLTKDEENKLLNSIETLQTKILAECVASAFFKGELLELLKSQNQDDIIKISRKLHEESPKNEITAVLNSFNKLINALSSNASQEDINKHLNTVSISGTLIHALVTHIKKKYSSIELSQKKLKELLAYFEVETVTDLRGLIENIKTNDVAKSYFVRKFMTNEQRLMVRVHDYVEYDASLKTLEATGITTVNSPEVKKLYDSITASEAEMKRFKDELIRRNLRLVISRAKKFSNRGLDFDDLVQEGNIGLIKAINKHDPTRGAKIGTHATWWIDQTIRRAISNKSKTVRIPTHIEFLQTQLSTIISKLTGQLGRPPTKEEIAEKANVTVDALERLDQIALHKIGIEEEMSNGVSMLEVLASDGTDNPFSLTAKKLLRERIRSILGTLHPRTEKIIRLRFGIGEPHEELTLQQIAESVGLTKMGVRLVQNKGLEKLKKKGGLNADDNE